MEVDRCKRCCQPIVWCIAPGGNVRLACDPKPLSIMCMNGAITKGRVLHVTTCAPAAEANPFIEAVKP